MKRQAERVGRSSLGHGYAYRGHEMGALAIGDQVLESVLAGAHPVPLSERWPTPLPRPNRPPRGATF